MTCKKTYGGAAGYECPECGNHVCDACARINFYVCPHCFARLYRIS